MMILLFEEYLYNNQFHLRGDTSLIIPTANIICGVEIHTEGSPYQFLEANISASHKPDRDTFELPWKEKKQGKLKYDNH